MNRYFVDERGGCIAVRDQEHTDPEYNGLHPDTEGVVKYWGSKYIQKKCPTCGHTNFSHWEIKQEDIETAHELAKQLNEKEQWLEQTRVTTA